MQVNDFARQWYQKIINYGESIHNRHMFNQEPLKKFSEYVIQYLIKSVTCKIYQ
jgi:hypothetical protein